MTDHETRSDGLRLLRVMNQTQARGSEEVPVTPALASHETGWRSVLSVTRQP